MDPDLKEELFWAIMAWSCTVLIGFGIGLVGAGVLDYLFTFFMGE